MDIFYHGKEQKSMRENQNLSLESPYSRRKNVLYKYNAAHFA